MFLVTDLDSRKDIFHGGYHGDYVVLVYCSRKVIRDKSERESMIKKKPTYFHETLQNVKGHAIDESVV